MAFFVKFASTGADPAYLFCRISHHQGVIGHIACHHRTGPDKGISADPVAADNGAIGAQGGTLLNQGGPDLFHAPDVGPGIDDIGEDHAGAAEDVIFQGDTFIDGNVILNLASLSDGDVRTDHDILTDVAVIAEEGTGQNMGKMPDLCPPADRHTVIHHRGFVNETCAGIRVSGCRALSGWLMV